MTGEYKTTPLHRVEVQGEGRPIARFHGSVPRRGDALIVTQKASDTETVRLRVRVDQVEWLIKDEGMAHACVYVEVLDERRVVDVEDGA